MFAEVSELLSRLLCGSCGRVRLAEDVRDYRIPARAHLLLERGYCICMTVPPATTGLAVLGPRVRRLYADLSRELEDTDPGRPVSSFDTGPLPMTSESEHVDLTGAKVTIHPPGTSAETIQGGSTPEITWGPKSEEPPAVKHDSAGVQVRRQPKKKTRRQRKT